MILFQKNKLPLNYIFIFLIASCSQNKLKKAEMKMVQDVIDMKLVSKPVNFQFQIKSVGTDTLKIFKYASSCGCTDVSLAKNNIPPGDSAFLNGTYKPEANGNFEKTIVLNTNTAEKFKVLRIKGFNKIQKSIKEKHP
jgi:hypothetical protein